MRANTIKFLPKGERFSAAGQQQSAPYDPLSQSSQAQASLESDPDDIPF